MSNESADPVETWAPMFTKLYSDERILTLVCREPLNRYCPLCDGLLPEGESVVTHRKHHERELRQWRKAQEKKVREEARARMARARAVRRLKAREANTTERKEVE